MYTIKQKNMKITLMMSVFEQGFPSSNRNLFFKIYDDWYR